MDILQFIVERYNYWIFIVLMMTGMYTVIARGNLVKKIIGLNIFQTSVFIYYISIGKVRGGTAPIYTTEHQKELKKDAHHGGHGSGHGGEHGEGHSDGHSENSHVGDDHSEAGNANDQGTGDHADSSHEVVELHAGDANSSDVLTGGAAHHTSSTPDLHAGDANALLDGDHTVAQSPAADHGGDHGADYAGAADFIEPIYSNPLPHVLILTAIVVGVATTAVGLALAVRIREAYGTIEEDELEAADNVAEFGVEDPREPKDSPDNPNNAQRQRQSRKLAGDRLNPGVAQ